MAACSATPARWMRRAVARGAAGLVLGLAMAHGAMAQDYVTIPGGRFESVLPQGNSPSQSVPVDIAPFALRATPVTAGEFERFVRAHPEWQRGRAPSVFADGRDLIDWRGPALTAPDAGNRPVTNVSWFAAKAYCDSEDARLPTWLEWEYAAAADETRRDARADPLWRRRILAWYERPSTSVLPPVGGAPNAYGVRDLHGLVWEWVDDFNTAMVTGESRADTGLERDLFCGAGSVGAKDTSDYAAFMRLALRSSLRANNTTTALGFRCAQDVLPTSQ